MTEKLNKEDVIDLRVIFQKLWHKKLVYLLTIIISFILGCIYILPMPRYYTTSVSLAPESDNADMASGNLGSIASSFGINLGGMQSSDAIYPLIYPDVISSTNFIIPLFNIKVTTSDGKLTTTYYDYLAKHQKSSPWSFPSVWTTKLINKFHPSKDNGNVIVNKKAGTGINPFILTKKQDEIVKRIQDKVSCNIDRRTNIITITVQDQDALISATIADSVKSHLQEFITQYRTSKAKKDVIYYQKLADKAKADYEKVRRQYGAYADANTDVTLESIRSKEEDLENDMQLKYNSYTAFNTQLQAAKANLQKRTPAFTTIQAASVPLKPAGPKRMVTVIGFMFLGIIFISIYILRKDIKELFVPKK